MRNILLVTDGWVHPSIMARFWLSYILTGPGYRYQHVRSLEGTIGLDLQPFQAMVLFFYHKTISDDALGVFRQFVENGGGVLGIHSVTASFIDNDEFTCLIGGKFTSHGPIETFEVLPTTDSRIFPGIKPFFVRDELYLHDVQADINIHFLTTRNSEMVPVGWTRKHGKGRLCYLSPGHKASTFRIRPYKKAIMLALEWVCQTDKDVNR